jgi:hypothetical protein
MAPSTSNYKVRGRDTLQNGIGVLGENRADSGDPVGVYGQVSDGYTGNGEPAGVYGTVPTADGFGLATPDDARVDGTLATAGSHRVTVDGDRALRLGPSGSDVVGDTAGGSVVGGYRNNSANGVVGATIGGGGASGSTSINGSIGTRDNTNEVTGEYGAIGGGKNNRANRFATVGGGREHTASARGATIGGGDSHIASAKWSTVDGGGNNEASGQYSTVGGGRINDATADYATVAGGFSNEAKGKNVAIGGGRSNVVSAKDATVGGGYSNQAKVEKSTIGGGSNNSTSGQSTTVGGGVDNDVRDTASTIGGGDNNVIEAPYSTVGGGEYNIVDASAERGTIAGGGPTNASDNPTGTRNRVTGRFGTVGGGGNNRAGDKSAGGPFATVGGGKKNAAGDSYATVAGGRNNCANDTQATVGGGEGNLAQGSQSVVAGGASNYARGLRASIGGGALNAAYGNRSVVGGGVNNRTGKDSVSPEGSHATIPGGEGNVATGSHSFAAGRSNEATGNYSFALGRDAVANTKGTFVWSDSSNSDFTSSVIEDQFVVEADGGVGIGTTATSHERLTIKGRNSDTLGTYGGHLVGIETKTTGGDVLAVRNSGEPGPGSGTNFVTFFDDRTDQSVGAIQGDGQSGVNYKSGNFDLAEHFPKADPAVSYESGDVVGLREGQAISDPTDGETALVVSEAPMVTGNVPDDDEKQEYVCLALTGQVPVRVRESVGGGEVLVATPEGEAVAGNQTTRLDGPVVGLSLDAAVAGEETVRTLVGGHGFQASKRPSRETAGTGRNDEVPDAERRIERLEVENESLRERLSELERRLDGHGGEAKTDSAPGDD